MLSEAAHANTGTQNSAKSWESKTWPHSWNMGFEDQRQHSSCCARALSTPRCGPKETQHPFPNANSQPVLPVMGGRSLVLPMGLGSEIKFQARPAMLGLYTGVWTWGTPTHSLSSVLPRSQGSRARHLQVQTSSQSAGGMLDSPVEGRSVRNLLEAFLPDPLLGSKDTRVLCLVLEGKGVSIRSI